MSSVKTLESPSTKRRDKSAVARTRPGRAAQLEVSVDSRWLGRRFSANE